MRQVIYPLVKSGINVVRPFAGVYTNDDIETVDGSIISDYEGTATVDELVPYTGQDKVPVSVTSITGPGVLAVTANSAIVKQETDLTIVISVPLPDNTTALIPLKRTDTGRLVKAFGTVMNSEVTLNIQIPTAGDWVSNSELINTETKTGLTFDFPGLLLNCTLNG